MIAPNRVSISKNLLFASEIGIGSICKMPGGFLPHCIKATENSTQSFIQMVNIPSNSQNIAL